MACETPADENLLSIGRCKNISALYLTPAELVGFVFFCSTRYTYGYILQCCGKEDGTVTGSSGFCELSPGLEL